jgi:HK97 family phage prohead protease
MKQTRFIPTDTCGLHVRETEDGQQSRTIEGKPIVFGVRSVNLTPWSETREVYEVLEPGCITNELLQRSDVILNLNHSSMVPDVLGRCKNGNGTLSLRLAGDHIECRCELPKTNNANDALELMKRGDITGMSFAFQDDYADSENGVSYERTDETHDGKEVWLRHVKRITGLYDVAIVTHPAYEQTDVATREESEAIDKAIEAQLKRECGDDEAKKKAEEEAKAEEERKAAEEAAKREAEANAKEEEEQRQLEEQEQRFREQQAMRMCAKARMLNEEILNSLEY